MQVRALLAVATLPLIAASGVQDGASDDIVVTGKRPAVRPGEWLFERGPTRVLAPVIPGRTTAGTSSRGPAPGFRYRMCIVDGHGDMRDAIGMMMGGDPAAGGGLCAKPRLRIGEGAIKGGFCCLFSGNGAKIESIIFGTVGTETADLTIRRSYESAKGTVVRSFSELKARRLGECSPR